MSLLGLQDLNPALTDAKLAVMNFLNEATLRYPRAISFASGRPREDFFRARPTLRNIDASTDQIFVDRNLSRDVTLNSLMQYGRTNGFISESLSKYLKHDEGIDVPPEALVVTVGAQEGMLLTVSALCRPGIDAILLPEPTYIGIVGVAKMLGVQIIPVDTDDDGLDIVHLNEQIRRAKQSGITPKLLYDTPDFSNPLGTQMPLTRREELLHICKQHRVSILEDNAYGMFTYGGVRLPTLKALDRDTVVIYLCTFAKTVFPGLRLGVVVADQWIADDFGRTRLADHLSKLKSMTTVNSPSPNQIMLANLLANNQFSLLEYNRERIEFYRRNRDVLLSCLQHHFSEDPQTSQRVLWNTPQGGFFLVLTLPFVVDETLLERSARDFGVIWVPMRFFHHGDNGWNQLRLSFSYTTPQEIEIGVARLASLIKTRLREERLI